MLGLGADADKSTLNEAGILPRAHVPHIVATSWEDEIVQGATTAFEPSEQSFTGRLDDLELHGSVCLLLNHDRPIQNAAIGNDFHTARHTLAAQTRRPLVPTICR